MLLVIGARSFCFDCARAQQALGWGALLLTLDVGRNMPMLSRRAAKWSGPSSYVPCVQCACVLVARHCFYTALML